MLARGLYRKDRQEPRIRVSSIKKDMSDAPWRGYKQIIRGGYTMRRFFIEEAKCEVAGGALSSRVIATVKYKEDGKDQWLSLVDVDGIPNA